MSKARSACKDWDFSKGTSDGWVINKKTKRIIMLEFKRTSDTVEKYYSEMKSIAERQHTPILEGLNTLVEDWGWVVEVLLLSSNYESQDIVRSGEKSD